MALALQSSLKLDAGDVVFEKSSPGGIVDLWVRPTDTLIEIKYSRPNLSGTHDPRTVTFGGLLADFNKVCMAEARDRIVVQVAHPTAWNYLPRGGLQLLPRTIGETRSIGLTEIQALPRSAATKAVEDGPWTPLSARLLWIGQADEWVLGAWRTMPQ
jgi:hypothetical protein